MVFSASLRQKTHINLNFRTDMPTRRHAWPRTVAAARAVQERLRGRVIAADRLGKVRFVAGIDIGFEKNGAITRAAVVVLKFPGLELHEQAIARRPTRFPYVPGYLSFREAPAALAALAKLRTRPKLMKARLHKNNCILLCDGQGLAHPRRFGLACHLGVLTGLPSIGVAKSLLLGKHGKLGEKRGARATLKDKGEVIGAVLRTRVGVRPVYISIGHRVSLATAMKYVLRCTPRYRLPETTRQAHRLASG